MMAMDHTIVGAASGETAGSAAPKGSQSQAKGQKSINTSIWQAIRLVCQVLFILFTFRRLEGIQSLFLCPVCSLFHMRKLMTLRGNQYGTTGIKEGSSESARSADRHRRRDWDGIVPRIG
ncbi:hypothetical protein D3C76_1412190 [compost metagenome]